MSGAHFLGDAGAMQPRESGLSFAAGSEVTLAAVPRHKLASVGSVHPHVGTRYDRYELIHPIGEGGMGTVWLARMRGEHGFERLVALKLLLPSFVRDLRYRNMFIDEARIASRVVHANVAQVIDLGEKDGNLYLVMEWVNGDSLSSLLRAASTQCRTVPLTVLLRIFADVCAGLNAAHDLQDQRGQPLNVVHRDVSPQNILVTDAGTVKVIDFGVVKARGRATEDTNPGVVKGKLQYMAPERAIGAEVDRRADIWTVGAILYRILAGRAACDADGNPALIWALVLRDQLEPLPSSVPPALARVVMKALEREPKDRHASAADLQDELERVLHGLSANSPTTSGDVASFVSAVLGPSLAERRAEIERALEGEEQTVTLHFLRPHIALVPPPAAPIADAASEPIAFPQAELPALRSSPVARAARATRLVGIAARGKTHARRLSWLYALGGLVLAMLAMGSRPSSSNGVSPGRATALPRVPEHAPAFVSARAASAELKALAETPAVNVDDLALESELVSPSTERARSAPLWKTAWPARSATPSLLGFQQERVLSLSSVSPTTSRLVSGAASTQASLKVEPKHAQLDSLDPPRQPLAKLVDEPLPAKTIEVSASATALKCNPPYAFDHNGRKKFRPECF